LDSLNLKTIIESSQNWWIESRSANFVDSQFDFCMKKSLKNHHLYLDPWKGKRFQNYASNIQKNILALGGLFGNVATDKVHPQPHISVFDNKKNVILLGRTHKLLLACRRFASHGDFRWTVEPYSTVTLFTPLSYCSLK